MKNNSALLKQESSNPFKEYFETPNEDLIPTIQKSTILDLDFITKKSFW